MHIHKKTEDNPLGFELSNTDLCPEAIAIGEGPLGGRGSSQVLISITTLSSD